MHAEPTTCAPPRTHSGKRRQRAAGFTLIELMTVVIIVGVLSAVAIPTFQNYLQKSRTAEASEFLGMIKLREESYRAEFGMYCRTVGGPANTVVGAAAQITALNGNAALMPNPSTVASNAGAPAPFTSTDADVVANFALLGARPSGDSSRFGFGVAAGPPNDLPGFGMTNANADFWFIARAVADLDRDGTQVTFETYSASKNVWIGVGNTAEPKGWE